MSKRILIEVCCGSVDDAIEAQKNGADRVELSSALMFGGLTPSAGAIIEAKRLLDIPVAVMVRPRGGGFCYTDREMAVMEQDVEAARLLGADAIVFGVLNEDGTVDRPRCQRMIELIGDREAVFHRAFDVTPDPFAALDELISLGVKRVLTKGQQNTLEEGASLIRELIARARGRVEILVAGAKPYNMESIVASLGCDQIHIASFTSRIDTSSSARPHVFFGSALRPPEDRYDVADGGYVRGMRERADGMGKGENF